MPFLRIPRLSDALVLALTLLIALCAGCGDDGAGADAGEDTGASDTGSGDSSVGDTGAGDTGSNDTGAGDTGAVDSGSTDAGETDSSVTDAMMDASADATADSGALDSGAPDTGPPISCTTDDMCPSGFWCRAVDSTGTTRECHPYAGEGDYCGGFVLPNFLERCDPSSAACLDLYPLLADAPGRCGVAATVTQLRASSATYDGRFVSVQSGWLLADSPACTELACSAGMPCCNSCFADEFFADAMTDTAGISLRDAAGVPYTCTGTNCDPLATCTAAPNVAYRASGTFDAATQTLTVETLSPLP